jgi:hypothetical protein
MNIQEYVYEKVITHLNEKDIEIEKLKKEIKRTKRILKENGICYQCICSRCKKKIPPRDETHSHNSHPVFETLCQICFYAVL